jgi:serine/threonine protein kinase
MEKTLQEPTLRVIGKYQIVAKLADGGMGTVFKGRDPASGALVAVKLASAALSRDKVLLKRFEQEFRSTRDLDHPNIVRGLEFGWTDSRPYIVMELVDGEDLWTRIERLGRISEAEAVHYITQAALGLHEAHKHGIIHRDIKPDNILLTADGQAKLADLGLCKDLEADQNLTCAQKGIGTPNFIAPEQFSDAKNAGVRCDIYSLGATLYMALTGELPFSASKLSATLKMKLANDLVAPSKLAPSLSEHVDWAVRRALSADPERRFANCPDFIAALRGEAGDLESGASGKRRFPTRRPRQSATKPERDRRVGLRFECSLPTCCTMNLSVHSDVAGCETTWDAQIQNLSIAGIGLLLSRRFEPGAVLTVEFTNRAGDIKLTRAMRVVRVAPAEEGCWFLGGTLNEELGKEELRLFL